MTLPRWLPLTSSPLTAPGLRDRQLDPSFAQGAALGGWSASLVFTPPRVGRAAGPRHRAHPVGLCSQHGTRVLPGTSLEGPSARPASACGASKASHAKCTCGR